MTLNGFPIERKKLTDLVKADYNPRKISEQQKAALQKSLKEFGTVEPIVWNRRSLNVVGGHQRLDALLALGEAETDVVIVDLPKNKEKALNIALNKISGEFDEDKLAAIFAEFQAMDFDMSLTGFEDKEIQRLIDSLGGKTGLTDDDAVPEVKESVCKTGELWQLGEHRLLCGDSTDSGSVAILMNGQRADMVFIDPPYAVNYGHDQKELQEKSGGKFSKTRDYYKISGDSLSTKDCAELIWRPAFHNLYEVAQPHCSIYMTMCQGGDQMMMMMMMMSEKWQVKHELIWVKNAPVFSMGRLDYDYKHEPILFGWKDKHIFYAGGEFKNSIWEFPKPLSSDLHPTMKPVALIENAVMNSSKSGDICIDFFLGSGSTLIACEKLNRKCYGIEIDPHYCDVIIKRWSDFTGKKAVLL